VTLQRLQVELVRAGLRETRVELVPCLEAQVVTTHDVRLVVLRLHVVLESLATHDASLEHWGDSFADSYSAVRSDRRQPTNEIQTA